ncbi:MAG: outer membrane protein assembly factor BamA, partial [Gammaproteobacteria bacterium]|nr:outer membrane protein assembly factor BamA [Gammaproteobacteria bacterium]
MFYRFVLRFCVVVCVFLNPNVLWAADNTFVVEAIEVKGGERVSVGTVLNYLPMRVGERYEDRDSAKLIRALFDTGMFNDVSLARDGSTLVVTVVERPAISEIKIEGNEKLEDEQLTASLNSLGIAKGRVFNRSVLERVQQEIRRLYFSQGNYGMSIKTTVVPLARNRVDIQVMIQEGEESKIKQINIIGNQRFSDELLLDQIESSESGALTFFSSADQYSRTKLAGDLEILRSYYQDRGYINFKVLSSQVSITPNKQGIYVTINIDEGEQYRVREVALAGRFVLAKESLEKLLLIEKGDIFSRRQVTNATSKISERLGDDGYAFANIDVVPTIDDEARQVDLKIVIDPGKRVYVRRIVFSGNAKTHDTVLRREMRQLEGGWLSPSKVKRSRIRLQRLSYIEQVSLETPKVAGRDDQVDLHVSITERSSGSFSIGAGYS